MSLEEEIINIIAKQMGIDTGIIEGVTEKTLKDMGADSLDIAEMTMILEDKYNIEIQDRELSERYGGNITIRNIIDYVKEKIEIVVEK
jgi:acyl carrier protein